MNQTLLDLYHRHVAAVFDRQMRLSDFVQANGAGDNWGYNVPSAALTLGESLQFQAPLLGSFAEGSGTWLWAWANRHLELPPDNAPLAQAVRELAKTHGLPLFAGDKSVAEADILPEQLSGMAPHVFGVVVAGELNYDAYYTLPYEGGRGVALIRDERLRVAEPQPLVRIGSIFPQTVASYPVLDHRAAFTSYVQSYGFEAEAAGRDVAVRSAGREVMQARFDGQDRLARLEATIRPQL